MNIASALYFAEILPRVTTIMALIAIVALIGGIIACGEDNKATVRRKGKMIAALAAAVLFIAIFVPSTKTIYLMIAADALEEVVEAAPDSALYQAVIDALTADNSTAQ